MTDEKMLKALEAIGKSGITVGGDIVLEKHVEYEVGNVEEGGIGIMVNGMEVDIKDAKKLASHQVSGQVAPKNGEPKEELFKFIHPAITGDEERNIHEQVKKLVNRQGIQEICKYLTKLESEEKIYLPQSADTAYKELVRMGMPNGDGFSIKTFMKYYKK